jgi:plastocyanin
LKCNVKSERIEVKGLVRERWNRAGATACALALVIVGCGSPQQQSANLPDAPAGEGSVTGRVVFEGTPPEPQVVRMSSDPLCMPAGGKAMSETILVGASGGLKNVFVHVKDAFGGQAFKAPTTPVVVDQLGCRYTPHVFGARVGQVVRIVNSDPTLHNVHGIAKVNPEFNFGQLAKGPHEDKVFHKPEVMIPLRCDVHGWMVSYVGVVPHPFFAVSGDDGAFAIKGLPGGTYTIEAWHERLGTQSQSVTSDGETPVEIAFTFKPQA